VFWDGSCFGSLFESSLFWPKFIAQLLFFFYVYGSVHRNNILIYRVFNLKVDRQQSREYFTSDAIYNGPAGMTLYYYMCRSWQNCCRRGKNQSWPSISVESADIWSVVDSECWCLNNAIFYAFLMRLTVKERVFILESYLKTKSYAHCRQSFFEKCRRQAPVKVLLRKLLKNKRTLRKVARNIVKRVDKCIEMNGHHLQHLLQIQVSYII
jgi:hypothetical protein